MILKKENLNLKEKLRELTEQLVFRELSDHMHSHIPEQMHTLRNSVSNGEDADSTKTPLDGSFDTKKKRGNWISTKNNHKARFSTNFARNSLTNTHTVSERKSGNLKFSVLEEKSTNQAEMRNQFLSNRLIPEHKYSSQQLSPVKLEGNPLV